MNKVVQTIEGTHWYDDILCIASFSEWFESCIDEHTTSSNLGTLLYEFKLSHNVVEADKNICSAKDEGAVNPSTVTRW